MAEQLYLLEVLLEKIKFFPTISVPQKKQIHVFALFGKIAQLEIRSDTPAEAQEGGSNRLIDFNAGKSYLFPYSAKDLVDALKTCPLEITVTNVKDSNILGTCTIPWNPHFVMMVQAAAESAGYVTPIDMTDKFTIKQKDLITAEIDVSLRLSCFGKSIQTTVQVHTDKQGGRSYLFKDSNAATTFKCEKYSTGSSDEAIAVAPIYNIVGGAKIIVQADQQLYGNKSGQSVIELFDDATQSIMSFRPMEFGSLRISEGSIVSHFTIETASGSQSTVIVLRERPDENKYFNLLSPDKEGDEDSDSMEMSSLGDSKSGSSGKSKDTKEGKVDEEELTADKINRLLCKNKDCPAAIKFKEFGIGPLATGKGLGTVYADVPSIASYGMSQTYGVLDNYGPYGMYTRPKRPDQPFVPRDEGGDLRNKNKENVDAQKQKLEEKQYDDDDDANHDPNCPFCAYKREPKPLRLKGGVESKTRNLPKSQSTNRPPVPEENLPHSKRKPAAWKPTRLRCGGVLPKDDTQHPRLCRWCSAAKKDKPLRLRGGGQVTMDDLQQQPKSPMLECKVIMDQFDKILKEYKQALGPCGKVSCPYAPNLIEDKCKIKCSDQPPDVKEHIDLLSCIDLDCPLIPAVGVKEKQPIDVSSNDMVSACATLDCPFKRRPMSEAEKRLLQKSGCGSPKCPFSKYKTGLMQQDADMEMQFMPPAVSGKCGHPKCPYPVKPDLPPIHWDCPDPLPNGPCKNPDCPYLPRDLKILRRLQKSKGPCGSPECCYAVPDPCDSPTCPLKPQPCPYTAAQQNTCPFMQNQEMGSCGDYNRDSDSCLDLDCPFKDTGNDPKLQCNNPNCPARMAQQGRQTQPNQPPKGGAKRGDRASEDSECDDPECPFRNQDPDCVNETCEDPECPVRKAKDAEPPCDNPYCPLGPPMPSCGIPNCPYEVPQPCPGLGSSPVSLCPHVVQQIITSFLTSDGAKKAGLGASLPCGDGEKSYGAGGADEEPERDRQRSKDDPDVEYTSDTRIDYPETQPCKPGTCAASGGVLVCEECPCSPCVDTEEGTKGAKTGGKSGKAGNKGRKTMSEGQMGKKNAKKKTQQRQTASEPGLGTGSKKQAAAQKGGGKEDGGSKQRRSKYSYTMGDQYPGVQVGHRECIMPGFNVPATMGWLWNVHTPCVGLKPRRGWRPGAIGKTLAKRIRDHRVAKGYPVQDLPDGKDRRKRRKRRTDAGGSVYESDSDSTVAPKPTLQIKKKEGCYWITMNPLKDPNTLADNENPYMDCTPMQFKITKNKNKVKVKTEEDDDYKTCYCCDEDEPTSTSSSDSELDIEFTPPAGIIRPDRLRKKKNVVHVDTQYNPQDCAVEKPPGKKDKKTKGGKGKKDKKGGKGGKKGGKGKKK